jgi:hypothetical protein
MTRHLIHIGYPKAGSTFLQAWFERHPDLHYQPGALGGFRDVYAIARSAGDAPHKYYVTSYEGLATPTGTAGRLHVVYGGAEPHQPDQTRESQRRVCSVLRTLYPESRILIVTRGYKARIMSGYSEFVKLGGPLHLKDMAEKVVELVRKDELHDYDYDFLIGLYAEAFGEENLLILPYELLRDDQRRFLAVLEAELGLQHAEIDLGRENPSLSPEELYWYPLISRAVSAAGSRLRPSLFRRVYGWYVRKTFNNVLRPLIRLLQLLRPGRRITAADLPDELLVHFEGKATRLKDHPLYAPYLPEYLLDS